MNGELTLMGGSPFDAIMRVRADGSEFWSARDLQPLMGYSRWESFLVPIERAMRTAENTNVDVASNFRGSPKISSTRPGRDFELSRFAAYLTAMNGDPNKPEVASAQAYFATKTREAETRELAQAPAWPVPQTFPEALELAARQARELEAERARNAELEPAAKSWGELAEASGDYSLREAAQILDRDPSIQTGQNRLARYLKGIGWCDQSGEPYQRQVDLDRLVRRSRSYPHPLTGESVATVQLRITVKGLHELHRLLGGSGPVLLEVA